MATWPDLGRISEQQRAVLLQIASGKTNVGIAHALGVAETTVKKRIYTLCARARVSCRVALVIVALKLGWIDLDEVEVDYVTD